MSSNIGLMRLTAVLILTVLAGGGFVGGVLLTTSPDGSAIGLSAEILPDWYAGDFRPAGVLLVTAFGIAPVAAISLLVARPRAGWCSVVLIGAFLLAWMAVQISMIGLMLPPMQIAFLLIGIVLVALGSRGIAATRPSHRLATH